MIQCEQALWLLRPLRDLAALVACYLHFFNQASRLGAGLTTCTDSEKNASWPVFRFNGPNSMSICQ